MCEMKKGIINCLSHYKPAQSWYMYDKLWML